VLCGRRPFVGADVIDLFQKASRGDFPDPAAVAPGLPDACADVIRRALQPRPVGRFTDAGAMEAAWAAAMGGQPAPAHADTEGTLAPAALASGGSAPTLDLADLAGPLTPPNNLPPAEDAFVGRRAALAGLGELLTGPERSRLVSVVGAGGVGKTRLALEYARARMGDFPGGVWLVDLSDARGLEGVCVAAAAALDVPLTRGDPSVVLGHAIAGRGRCLLLLDNFEHLAAHAAATAGAWATRAAEATLLVTTRELLRLPGERVFPLEPLPLPETPRGDEGASAEAALNSPAGALFAARAKERRPAWSLAPAQAGAMVRLLRLLEGIPLAIELAAARAGLMLPSQMVERMADRFRLLRGRGRAGRQATLRATIEWSWGLLDPAEQAALAQLSVFEGGITLDAAEAVLALPRDDRFEEEVVEALIDKSLLRPPRQRHPDSPPRLSLFVSVQRFAAEALLASGGAPEAAHRHAAFFARSGAWEALSALRGADGAARWRALGEDLDNLLAATRHSLAAGRWTLAARAALAAASVLQDRGPLASGAALLRDVTDARPASAAGGELHLALAAAHVEVLRCQGQQEEALAAAEAALPLVRSGGQPRWAARLLGELGTLRCQRGHMDAARGHYEAALAASRSTGDVGEEARALGNLGTLQSRQRRSEEALSHYEAALRLYRAAGDRRGEAGALGNLGLVHHSNDRAEEARACYAAALAVFQETGARRSEVKVLSNRANLRRREGALDAAREDLSQALRLTRSIGHRPGEGIALGSLGDLFSAMGSEERAVDHYEAALAVFRETGDRWAECDTLNHLGILRSGQGRLDAAQRHYEDSLAVCRATGDRSAEGNALSNLGSLHGRRGQWGDARDHLGEALRLFREIGHWRGARNVLSTLGQLELKRGRADLARGHLEAAMSVHREADSDERRDRRSEGNLLGALGVLCAQEGRHGPAGERLQAALALHRETGHRRGEALALVHLGALSIGQGRWEAAEEALARARALLGEAGPPLDRAALCCARGRLHLRRGHPPEAAAPLPEAEALTRGEVVTAAGPLGRSLAALREAVAAG